MKELKTKLFRLVSSDYDGYEDWILYHETKTPDEFKEDCIKALRDSGEYYVRNAEPYIGREWFPVLVDKLIEYGYRLVRPVEYMLNLPSIIEEADRGKCESLMGEELFRIACERNYAHRLDSNSRAIESMRNSLKPSWMK